MSLKAKRYPLEINLPGSLLGAIQRLASLGASCRVVGGSVRDALLGLAPKDFDVEVYGLPLETIAQGLRSCGKTDLVGKSFAVVKLWTPEGEFDFSVPRRERKTGSGHRAFEVECDPQMDEAEALARRDFTCNALLYDPGARQAIDYYGGGEDLQQRLLRHVGPAFAEDPLRVLRGMQFAGRFSLQLHPDTAALCASMRQEFWSLPKERLWGEWEKWASRSVVPSLGLSALKQSGWLPFFPELNALVGLPQDPEWHPEGDVWTHTLCCLDALSQQSFWQEAPDSQRTVLSLAVLCHDLGKARCTRYVFKRRKKRWISPGHDSAGVWLTEQLLARIGAPKLVVEKACTLVGNHHFLNSHPSSGPSPASLKRLARRLLPASSSELHSVMLADHLGRPPRVSEEQTQRLKHFAVGMKAAHLESKPPSPILLGRHLIELGLEPGREFKAYLEEAYEAQLDGLFADESAGREWIRERLEKEGGLGVGF